MEDRVINIYVHGLYSIYEITFFINLFQIFSFIINNFKLLSILFYIQGYILKTMCIILLLENINN